MSLGKTWRVAAQISIVSIVALMALAASASAATVSINKLCYAVPQNDDFDVPFSASGLTPGERVVVKVADPHTVAYDFFNVAGDGTVSGTLEDAYTPEPGLVAQKMAVQVEGLTSHVVYGETPIFATNLGVEITGKVARGSKVDFSFAGFDPKAPLWAHYVANGKEAFSHQLGTTDAPCGILQVKDLIFPAKHSRHRRYTIQFDNSKKYSPDTQPQVREGLTTGLF